MTKSIKICRFSLALSVVVSEPVSYCDTEASVRRPSIVRPSSVQHFDYHLCGRRFLRNRMAEFNETWYNDSIEGVVNARSSIFKVGSCSTPWWKIAFSKNTEFDCSDLDMCGLRFHRNCEAEFNEI